MKSINTLVALCALATSPYSFSETLTSLQSSETDTSWSHWWNPDGELGDPQQYLKMVRSDEDEYKLIALPKDPGWLFVGPLTENGHVGQIGGLPGPGPEQTDKPYGYAAIFACTLTSGGKIALSHSTLSSLYESQDGISISVFVNGEPEPRLTKGTEPGTVSEVSFDVALGDLIAGDTIYLAVSPNQNNFGDSFGIDCDVVLEK